MISSPFITGLSPIRPRAHPSAMRASLMLFLLGGGALVLGLGLIAASFAMAPTLQTPQVQQMMTQLHLDSIEMLRLMLRISGVMFAGYAIAALGIALLVRRGTLPWLIVGTVLAVTVVGFVLLTLIVSLIKGQGDFVLPTMVGALHGVVIYWLIDAMRRRTESPLSLTMTAQTQLPLAAYYASLPSDSGAAAH